MIPRLDPSRRATGALLGLLVALGLAVTACGTPSAGPAETGAPVATGTATGSAPSPSTTPAPSPEPLPAGVCARAEDYVTERNAPATPRPTIGPMPSTGAADGLTAGVLQTGQAAFLGDDDGPGAQLRVGNVRVCDRYPNARPTFAGYRFVALHVELLVLRDGFMSPFISNGEYLAIRRADDPVRSTTAAPPIYNVPGENVHSALRTHEGDTYAGDLLFEVAGGPGTDLFADFRFEPVVRGDPAVVSWALGPFAPYPAPTWTLVGPTPAPVATSGVILPGQATVFVDGVAFVVSADRIAQVDAYPGVEPARGSFVEVAIAGAGIAEWRAVHGAGATLDWPAFTAYEAERLVVRPLLGTSPGVGWLVIDAPPTGEIRLEYRRNGEGPVLFEVLVREG